MTAIVAGLLTATAGLIFVARPLAPYFSVANVVTLWLALRGLWVLAAPGQGRRMGCARGSHSAASST